MSGVWTLAASPRARATREDSGFTLLESIAAAAVLLIVATGVITVLIFTSNWYAKARVRTQAMVLAERTMAIVLSRNSNELHYAAFGEVWPAAIPFSRDETTPLGVFSIETSLAAAVDPGTELDVTRVTVTVKPTVQPLDPPVSLVRYSSGWQQTSASTAKFYTRVKVTLRDSGATEFPGGTSWAGVRVQLLNVDNPAEELYHATTDENGIANFTNVLEGQYYLTCDPRFGTNLRPLYYPMRISPTHGGSINNPIPLVNSYTLDIACSSIPATLRVGAYKTEGWTIVNGSAEPPELPYKTFPGEMVVYAKPVLNVGVVSDPTFYGMGEGTLYPDESQLPVYSGTVNAYGVASIQIPYTTMASAGQHWHVWCRTKAVGSAPVEHALSLPTAVQGDWDPRVQRPEGAYADPLIYCNIAQFTRLGENVTALNIPALPAAFP